MLDTSRVQFLIGLIMRQGQPFANRTLFEIRTSLVFKCLRYFFKNLTSYCETVLSGLATIGAVQLKRAHSFILLFICEMRQSRDYL